MSLIIGSKLRQLRKSKRLTQDQIAEQVGITRSTISNYEIGRRTPHLKDLARIAEVFGVGLDYFGVTTKDEAFDLLVRAKEVFENPYITKIEKEMLYQEFMKLYLTMKGNEIE